MVREFFRYLLAGAAIGAFVLGSQELRAEPPKTNLSQSTSNLMGTWEGMNRVVPGDEVKDKISYFNALSRKLSEQRSTSVTQAGQQFSTAEDISGLGITDDQFRQITELFNQALLDINGTLSTATQGMIGQWSRTNDGLLKLVDPWNMFLVGGGVAAGGVIGAAIGNLVVEGISTSVRFLWDLATGKRKSERDANGAQFFNQARKEYETLKKSAPDFEASIENSYDLLMLGRGIGGVLFEAMDAVLKESLELAERGEVPNGQWRTVVTLAGGTLSRISGGEKLAELSKQIEKQTVLSSEWRASLGAIRTALHELGSGRIEELSGVTTRRYCASVRSTFRTLTELDKMLQDARLEMIRQEKRWVGWIHDDFEANEKKLKEARRQTFASSVGKSYQAASKGIEKFDSDQIDRLRSGITRDCYSLKPEKGVLRTMTNSEFKIFCEYDIFKTKTLAQIEAKFGKPGPVLQARVLEFDLIGRITRLRDKSDQTTAGTNTLRVDTREHVEEILDSNREIVLDSQTYRELLSSTMTFIDALRAEQGLDESILISKHLTDVRNKIDLVCESVR